MLDRCHKSDINNGPEFECLHKAWKSGSDILSHQNCGENSALQKVYGSHAYIQGWKRFLLEYDVYT